MAFEDFVNCCSGRGVRDVQVLEEYGADVVRELAQAWQALPLDVKSAIITSITYGGEYVAAAIAAAAGIAASELLAWIAAGIAAGVGLGVFMDVVVECVESW